MSGGGGAKPYEADRTAFDLYQDPGFPNYHYVKFVVKDKTLSGTMYRFPARVTMRGRPRTPSSSASSRPA
jgi:hypothetical protein